MQCGTGIINPGDSQERVLELCGQPVRREAVGADHSRRRRRRGYGAQIDWAEWGYQNGPDQFVYKVVFRNGVVYEIKSQGGGRGLRVT